MTRILFKFVIYLSCERALRNGRVKSKVRSCLWTSLWSEQLSYIRLYWVKLKQNRIGQVFLRFEIVIFNNNFVFCVMSSFSSMARVAGWILAREIIKSTNIFYPVCLKKYWKKLDKHLLRGLFCENCAIAQHNLLKMNQTTC